MIPFKELRASLQTPRKTADAWYGKWVIRRISIYITWLFARLGFGPNQTTFLSLVCALIGIFNFTQGNFAIGVLGINLWYLLDHVDGEIARLRNDTSLAGTFFDTVINFLIQPFTFLGLCVGLGPRTGWEALYWGMIAALGSLMLLAIPMTEEAVLFNESIKRKVTYQKNGHRNSSKAKDRDFFRRGYGLIHTLVTYPCVLLIMTTGYLVFLILTNNSLHQAIFLYRLLIVYACVVTFIWVSQLFYKVYFRTLDRYWKPISGA